MIGEFQILETIRLLNINLFTYNPIQKSTLDIHLVKLYPQALSLFDDEIRFLVKN